LAQQQEPQPPQRQQPVQQLQALHGAAWAQHISKVSLSSLDRLWSVGYFDEPLQWRLGFRYFGTSIGLQACITTHSHYALLIRMMLLCARGWSGAWVQEALTLTVYTCTSSDSHSLALTKSTRIWHAFNPCTQ
jgi:hypothetical protein